MNEVVIVAAGRTAVGKLGGTLSKIPAAELGAHVIRHLLAQIGLDSGTVDEVIMGQVLAAGCGQNPARQASIRSGLPNTVPAFTINKVCGSGLKAVHLAAQAIRCGDAQIVIAGGQENMSLAPQVLHRSHTDMNSGDTKPVDTMLVDGLQNAYDHCHMGMTAENIARKFGITRAEQDTFALASQQKADMAQQAGRFQSEIIPLETIPNTVVAVDEHPRHGMTQALLESLRPAFVEGGTVTAGNASGINDGAAAVMLMSADKARELGIEPLVRIKATASAGVEPSIMGMGPVPASRQCLKKASWTHQDLDLMEINEAFAAQAIAVNREMGWDIDRINVNGGAIALGHPIGASGCRILVTLIHEMMRRDAHRGLASLCIGGGMGIAMAIER
ncbi:acetyl-CoA C-acetyltransferase [Oxalicibacterium solurbis]|uniref:Acetyl-CoA acetyltransferase n=1 Tax=Oxalicibacterium solurbis TaxID=69280 RepID=A0A8J3AUI8_9BURK|nr:acetyl-CoA C-acetyltransferase [Oxalicibacterium solurbis]GGI53919.1 acetyl-CoA acetyltransferase [Oxalicibacterium solurbis]